MRELKLSLTTENNLTITMGNYKYDEKYLLISVSQYNPIPTTDIEDGGWVSDYEKNSLTIGNFINSAYKYLANDDSADIDDNIEGEDALDDIISSLIERGKGYVSANIKILKPLVSPSEEEDPDDEK